MRLTELIAGLDTKSSPPADDFEVAGISADSRNIRPGEVFVAIPGSKVDGRKFIAKAIAAGAGAVVVPPGTRAPKAARDRNVPLITSENPRRALSLMAARVFAPQPHMIVGVTGTNGKTSVAGFVRQIWTWLGRPAASLGTLGVEGADVPGVASLTTPDPVGLHRTLAALAKKGTEFVAMEASSHGLAQSRLDGVHFQAAGFTNLTRDHLDYHGTMEAYLAAKRHLFADLLPVDGMAVLNANSDAYENLSNACLDRGCRVVSYGPEGADISVREQSPRPDGQDLIFTMFGRSYEVGVKLPGAFQAANLMCALGLVIACGEDAEAAINALPHLTGAQGRMQLVARRANGAPVYVDYAHTPDALYTVLKAIRPHTPNRLVVVFGCGGDRDRGKRPMMGNIAAGLADVAIVTDDNPRTEDAASIRAEIMADCVGGREVGDRMEAIHAAVAELGPGDVLVIAGKGHEQGQIVGGTAHPFDDGDVAREAVRVLDGEMDGEVTA